MTPRKPKRKERRDLIVRMKPGDKIIIEAKARRRVRVLADEGVDVEHVKRD